MEVIMINRTDFEALVNKVDHVLKYVKTLEPNDKSLTIKEAAAILKYDPDTVRKKIRSGEIHKVAKKGSIRIMQSEIHEYLNRKRK